MGLKKKLPDKDGGDQSKQRKGGSLKASGSSDSLVAMSLWGVGGGLNNRAGQGRGGQGSSMDFIEERGVDDYPYSNGHHLVVRYRDGSERLCKIIESREAGNMQYKYYIHYLDFNRRMDEWIDDSRIIKLPSVADAMAGAAKPAHGAGSHDASKNKASADSAFQRNEFADDFYAVSELEGFGNEFSDDSGFDLDGSEDIDMYSEQGGVSSSSKRLKSNGEDDVEVNFPQGNEITTVAELEHDEHEGMDAASLLEHEEITKVKNINLVQLGKYVMECWYFSPYPREIYAAGPVDCLYVCEFTFRYFTSKDDLIRFHQKTLPYIHRHPPGNEIYRDNKIAFFEVDGAVEKVYCQNLATFAKLFLDHKTLYWDVDPFLFYILCTYDDRGYHPVGFFSKEKFSDAGYNLACILTFPSSQKMGFGRLLISFSYELSKKELKAGSPEKPLSDLGAISYKSYWLSTLLPIIQSYAGSSISILELSRITSILSDDIIFALHSIGILQEIDVPNSSQPSPQYIIYAPPDLISELISKYKNTGHTIDSDKLHWAPLYVTDPKKDKWSLKAKLAGSNPSSSTLSLSSTNALLTSSSSLGNLRVSQSASSQHLESLGA